MNKLKENILEYTDEKLIEYYQGLHDSVYNMDCYSTSDLSMMYLIGMELEKRGYELHEITTVTWIKKEQVNE
jgi:hypothetical protein